MRNSVKSFGELGSLVNNAPSGIERGFASKDIIDSYREKLGYNLPKEVVRSENQVEGLNAVNQMLLLSGRLKKLQSLSEASSEQQQNRVKAQIERTESKIEENRKIAEKRIAYLGRETQEKGVDEKDSEVITEEVEKASESEAAEANVIFHNINYYRNIAGADKELDYALEALLKLHEKVVGNETTLSRDLGNIEKSEEESSIEDELNVKATHTSGIKVDKSKGFSKEDVERLEANLSRDNFDDDKYLHKKSRNFIRHNEVLTSRVQADDLIARVRESSHLSEEDLQTAEAMYANYIRIADSGHANKSKVIQAYDNLESFVGNRVHGNEVEAKNILQKIMSRSNDQESKDTAQAMYDNYYRTVSEQKGKSIADKAFENLKNYVSDQLREKMVNKDVLELTPEMRVDLKEKVNTELDYTDAIDTSLWESKWQEEGGKITAKDKELLEKSKEGKKEVSPASSPYVLTPDMRSDKWEGMAATAASRDRQDNMVEAESLENELPKKSWFSTKPPEGMTKPLPALKSEDKIGIKSNEEISAETQKKAVVLLGERRAELLEKHDSKSKVLFGKFTALLRIVEAKKLRAELRGETITHGFTKAGLVLMIALATITALKGKSVKESLDGARLHIQALEGENDALRSDLNRMRFGNTSFTFDTLNLSPDLQHDRVQSPTLLNQIAEEKLFMGDTTPVQPNSVIEQNAAEVLDESKGSTLETELQPYVMQSGDTIWDFVEGDVAGHGALPVLENMTRSEMQSHIKAFEQLVKNSVNLQVGIGIGDPHVGYDFTKTPVGTELNVANMNQIMSDIVNGNL